MTIHLRLGGQLRSTIGCESVAIELTDDAARLGSVLEEFCKTHPDARDMLLKPDGSVAGGLLVLIDDAAAGADCELAIADGATVTLLPAISGG